MKHLKLFIPIIAILTLALAGCATDANGKKTLDPEIRDALIDVAKSAVAGLAAGAQSSGTIHWQDAAQGALKQVYAVESTNAIDKAVSYSGLPTDYQSAITTAVGTVVNAAKNQGLTGQTAILAGTTALDQALQAAKSK